MTKAHTSASNARLRAVRNYFTQRPSNLNGQRHSDLKKLASEFLKKHRINKELNETADTADARKIADCSKL